MNEISLAFALLATLLSVLALIGVLLVHFYSVKTLLSAVTFDDLEERLSKIETPEPQEVVSLVDPLSINEAEVMESNKALEENVRKMFFRFPEDSEPVETKVVDKEIQ